MNPLSGGWHQHLLRVCLALAFALSPAAAVGFEQDHRINGLTWQFVTDSFATKNAFGGAVVGGFARQALQSSINTSISDGSISLLFTMPGLVDLTGTSEPSLQFGVANGAPVILPDNPASYSGGSDLDWWYVLNSDEVDATGQPIQQMFGFIAAKLLSAGPGRLTFGNAFGQGSGRYVMSSAVIKAAIGATSAPLQSTNSLPPGHRPGEQIDPALQSFASMSSGQLKGNISAASLANIPIPQTLIGGQQGYTADNSLLDVFVGGWSQFFLLQIRATQPDEADSSVPAGSGPPYILIADPSTKKVIACRDGSGMVVSLSAGLNAAAYSAYFRFTTDRVIVMTPPEIALADALGTNIADGGGSSFGSVATGTNTDVTFTIKNSGLADLTGLAITVDGNDASMFTVLTNPAATVAGANGSTAFTVRFAPASTGIKTAELHISSNDSDENPFDILLSGLALTPPNLAGATRLGSGAFRFVFTNHPDAGFTILATTNLERPLSNWTIIGVPVQTASGLFEFSDPDATNHTRRFYSVRSP